MIVVASTNGRVGIADAVEVQLRAAGVSFRETYYCFHHPTGVVPEYSGPCACRKPQPYFLHLAAERYGLDLSQSWMVGDRDTDVQCGQRAGCRTIFVTHPQASPHDDSVRPDFVAPDVAAAVALILGQAAGRAPLGLEEAHDLAR